MKDAIRLTNKTAVALRRSAIRIRGANLFVVAAITAAAVILAVWWGLQWLPAVPLTLGAASLLDALLLIRGRGAYLSMISQAICTEAAAREIRAGSAQYIRREQALADLMSAKADLSRREPDAPGGASPFFEADGAATDDDSPAGENAPVRRRRRQNGLQIIRNQQMK